MVFQGSLDIQIQARELRNITDDINTIVERAAIDKGLCHVFLHHTSATIILSENADPSVCDDLSPPTPDGNDFACFLKFLKYELY